MNFVFFLISYFIFSSRVSSENNHQRTELQIVNELFRLRNEHKADSAEIFYADTVLVYMKYLRNIPKRKITQSDKIFWKTHPDNKFEMVAPVKISNKASITSAIIYGKEYLDGKNFKYEKIEIRFDKNKKINYYRGFHWKK